jgi:murein DD-endopeptidase MepM/ murein hydrolase activator NlpD
LRRASGRVLLHVPVCLMIGTTLWKPMVPFGRAEIVSDRGSLSATTSQHLPELDDWVFDVVAASSDDPAVVGASEAGLASWAEVPGANSVEVLETSPNSVSGGPGPLVPLSHTVQSGESLATIAERFGVDVPTLLSSNDLSDPDLVAEGVQLKVLPVPGVLHRVAEDDTLNQIAARYDLTVADILRANNIENADVIAPGQELLLPGAKPVARATPPVGAEPAIELDWIDDSVAAAESPESRSYAPASWLADDPNLSTSRPTLVWPAKGPITTRFGQVGWASPRGHAGLDIAAPSGAPVVAAASGQVLVAAPSGGGYGIHIIIDHGRGLRTVYAHLSRLHTATGQQVSRGQLIGLVGSTGFSTGPHLHFETRQNGDLLDPLGYLPKP